MAGRKLPRYYWDTCILLDHLKGSCPEPLIMQGIDECVKKIDGRSATLITSVITRLEILQSKTPEEAFKKLASMFDGAFKVMVQVSPPIVDEAYQIRNAFPGLSVPDCLHLATAIIYEADEFHTRDGSGTAKKSRKLLPLSGDQKLKGLKICIPPVKQMSLPVDMATVKPRVLPGLTVVKKDS